jgi:hypothetical protein
MPLNEVLGVLRRINVFICVGKVNALLRINRDDGRDSPGKAGAYIQGEACSLGIKDQYIPCNGYCTEALSLGVFVGWNSFSNTSKINRMAGTPHPFVNVQRLT